eukprot:1160832-Pelagomonas_calceolata.AAC.1
MGRVVYVEEKARKLANAKGSRTGTPALVCGCGGTFFSLTWRALSHACINKACPTGGSSYCPRHCMSTSPLCQEGLALPLFSDAYSNCPLWQFKRYKPYSPICQGTQSSQHGCLQWIAKKEEFMQNKTKKGQTAQVW